MRFILYDIVADAIPKPRIAGRLARHRLEAQTFVLAATVLHAVNHL